jgi:subtilisin family serine protease
MLAVLFGAGIAYAAATPRQVEVVVALDAPPLARAIASSRALTTAARTRRLNLRAPTSVAYLRALATAQASLEARITGAIPDADVRWRYRIVLNALAVAVPFTEARRLSSLPGVARVYPSVRYRAQLDRTPGQIGATALWGSSLELAGNGLKIGILDDGVDQTHPFFDPRSYTPPPGFPKGQRPFTTAKVIVARAFSPPTPAWRYAARPFDPQMSEHGTHVAGIAAGNRTSVPSVSRTPLAGVAPRAYIGNYKVLTIPTVSGVGLDGNSPEIAAGIEAAVRDGMDVINLSLGEPEIEPSRDLVVRAINAAADAGVVPAVAAGNDYSEFGDGSIGSPGSAAQAITAAAVSSGRSGPVGVVTGFSSGGPTPVSLLLKPDVAAPGGEVLSSVPVREGTWAVFSGTSMASPHVAGAAALLRQRHPTWTTAQVKSALVLTGRATGASAAREGGGVLNLVGANDPLVFAAPSSLSFGRILPGGRSTRTVALTDAGGGAGPWTVQVVRQTTDGALRIAVPASVTVPGLLEVSTSADGGAREDTHDGFVVLSRGETERRIPFLVDVAVPDLRRHRAIPLRGTGTFRGNTAGRPSLVSAYRYPEGTPALAGPEQVFRVRLARAVANFGVAILGGANVQARIVAAGDENRQVGYTALPFNLNPYLRDFGEVRRVSGAIRPAPGRYDVVFDSVSRAGAGRFTFRFWIGDTAPPSLRLQTRVARDGAPLEIAATDAGSGVDPESIEATVDGRPHQAVLVRGRVRVATAGLSPGRHRLVLQVSDYQETRNNENVLHILPNTRRLAATFTVR